MNPIGPLISFVIPCYNAAPFLVEAIESVINQTYRNLEIILIDDGSTDETLEILKGYEHKDNRIKLLINEDNIGLIRSLNKGVEFSSGDFIARMDADDISILDRIEILYDEFVKHPELDAVSASACYISVNGKSKGYVYPKATLPNSLMFMSFFSTPVVHACILIRSKIIKKEKYDIDYIHSEDYELFSRMIEKGVKFKNISDVLYKIRLNPQSVSRKFESIQKATHTRISIRNIENYFNSIPEYYLHKVIVNRIGFKVTPKLIIDSFHYLDNYCRVFIEREKANELEIQEIDKFILEQKIDILFQSIKYTQFPHKLIIIGIALEHIRKFIDPRGRKYIKNKFHM